MRALVGFVVLSVSALVVSAQTSSVTAEMEFFDSNPTIVKLPVPNYPAEAKKSGLSGVVSVKITVDETGKVTSADDADGPYPVCKSVTDLRVLAMRAAAIDAAKKAKFKSATLDNRQANISGRIRYNFVANVEARPVEEVGARAVGGNAKLGEISKDKITALGNSGTGAKVDNPAATSNTGTTSEPPPPAVSRVPNTPIYNPATKSVAGGVLNGKAIVLAKPKYPAAARAVRASGPVSVQALIDEQGNMYSAKALTGHPLLRRNSEIAACDSRFSPTLLSGQPVKVSGIITYNYVP